MTDSKTSPSGTILHLQRLSTEDGPGIRTTVFFKGCPLRCQWCHNPESLSPRPQAQWLASRCIGCESCVEACPQGGLERRADGIWRDRVRCISCGTCVEVCPSGAMELLGRRVDATGLVKELLKDRTYFEKSGGGVTFSGGEPTLQPYFAAALARGLAAAGVAVALDTCGLCAWQTLEELLPDIGLVLYDLKLADPDEHNAWTGVRNEIILENFTWLAKTLRQRWPEKRMWVRTPLIPGATFSRQNLAGIGEIIRGADGTVERWELCAFNNLCRDQYARLGLEWAFASTPLLSAQDLEQAGQWARASAADSEKIFVTGAARVVKN